MNRIAMIVVKAYAVSIWHWIPFVASIGIALSMLLPIESGVVPDFATRYGIRLDMLRVFWFAVMLSGAGWLYTHRDSWGFFFGCLPILTYSLSYIGWGVVELRNPAEAFLGAYAFGMTVKTFFRLRNGKISNHE